MADENTNLKKDAKMLRWVIYKDKNVKDGFLMTTKDNAPKDVEIVEEFNADLLQAIKKLELVGKPKPVAG